MNALGEQLVPEHLPDSSEVLGPKRVNSAWGFGRGLLCGAGLMLVSLLASQQQSFSVHGWGAAAQALGSRLPMDQATAHSADVWSWIALNLGHSFWLFTAVLLLYVVHIAQLHRLLLQNPQNRRVTELDQLTDVWMHLFVGVGVIWTAVGMRSALQAALGDSSATIVDSADAVLRKLVDGGILLALTTTIVGGIGGYLMRLVKTVLLGTRLQELYEQQQRRDVQALLAATQRIESHMAWSADEQLEVRPEVGSTGDAHAPA